VVLGALRIRTINRFPARRHRALRIGHICVHPRRPSCKHRGSEGVITRRHHYFEVQHVRNGLHDEVALLDDSADGNGAIGADLWGPKAPDPGSRTKGGGFDQVTVIPSTEVELLTGLGAHG